MSTLRTINVIHPSGSTTNIVNDNAGNVAVGGTLTASTITSATSTALTIQSAGTTAMTVDTSGNLLVGTTNTTITAGGFSFLSPSSGAPGYYQVYRNTSVSSDGICDYYSNYSSTKNNVFRVSSNGQVTIAAGATYTNFSDIALKKNVVDATPKLADLMKIKIRNYNLINDEEDNRYLGWIAQEVAEVFPSLVVDMAVKDTTVKAVKESVFIPMLVKAVQELSAKNDALEASNAAFERRLAALENK
jgi:hypothetical protein